METYYEWGIEQTDEFGDIIDSDFAPTLKELNPAPSDHLVLVRSTGSEAAGVVDREWVYPMYGKLPDEFESGAKVPNKYKVELSKFVNHIKSKK